MTGIPQDLPAVCDDKEQEAFEAWARSEGMDMSQHPLHWLFLDQATSAARDGWRAAIEYCRASIAPETNARQQERTVMNHIVIGDSIYDLTESYREGARACREGQHYHSNPHRGGCDASQEHDDWNYGYGNEEDCEHVRFGIDVISADSGDGRTFEEDTAVPRSENGIIDDDWYRQALASCKGQTAPLART